MMIVVTPGHAADQPPSAGAVEPAADLILLNGDIKTPTGWVQAMAVRDGVIVALGSNADVAKLQTSTTQKLDLGGKAVLPGLHDSHVHALGAGLEQYACGFAPGSAPEAIAAAVKACVKEVGKGEWISGGNWVAAVFKPGQQTREFLDAIAPDNPVILSDESHHSSWVNSKALELAGITDDTPNPPNGVIERDANGRATGLLRETASGLVGRVMPPPNDEAKNKALTLSSAQMLSYGITSFVDAGVTADTIGTYAGLSASGAMKQRVTGCIRWVAPSLPGHEATMALIRDRAFYTRGRFSADCVKVVLDGVPTESHTAAMLAPYVGHSHGSAGGKGMLMVEQNELNSSMAAFDRDGLLIKFHAAGDAAVRAAIDSIAYARSVNGTGGQKHDVGHNSFVDPADIPRVHDLYMTWEFSPYIWYPTPIAAQDIRKAVGDERMERWIPIKDAVDTGALVVAGSDWSVVPSVNPWLAIETMVTRQIPGGSNETLGIGQAVDLETAFRIFTENGAAQLKERSKWGALEQGMLADFIVTERNPFKIPITEVHKTKVTRVYIEGDLVFDAANPPTLKAH
ncbi:MAG: amidohydrolase [Alphaproteobacteria bacterium]|nr:amidohydrolase [Alphaproteobacteria bacterium]MBU0875879.1 amidohydrolase [Alphaproteobacteria bacterium]MBU1769940.1 amidohydrolase [Alphaproteobacteria bacterium]